MATPRISNNGWSASLRASLKPPKDSALPPRLAIVGIGNELRGDDAAGVEIARSLRHAIGARQSERLDIIEAGQAPENCTGVLRRFRPELILLVDAADLNQPPGSAAWLSWEMTEGLSACTHALPLFVLARFLRADLRSAVALLGIQPAQRAPFALLSPPVERAVGSIARELALTLRERDYCSSLDSVT